MDEASKTGGVVYLPAGIYSLYTSIAVPAGVELRGSTTIMQRDTKWRNVTGTVLLSYVGEKSTVTLKQNAGIVGVRLWSLTTSAKQALAILSKDAEHPLAKVACVKGDGSGVYMTDSMIVGAFIGIDFTNCDNHTVNHILGEPYISLVVAGGKNGYIGQCHANAFASDNKISAYFDPEHCDITGWAGDAAYVSPDLMQRKYRITYQLVGAKNETVMNIGNYAVNAAIDTLKGNNSMFEIRGSQVNIVNAMRLFGTSFRMDDSTELCILNRNDRLNISEAPFNSAVSQTENVTRRFEGEDIKKILLDCDSIPSGVGYSDNITVVTDADKVKAGSGAWQIMPTDNVLFTYRLPNAMDISDYAYRSGYLHLWIYVEDMSAITDSTNVQLEMTSTGDSEFQEIFWRVSRYIKQNGWNEIYLPLDTTEITPGKIGDSRRGDFNAEKFNYMRFYVEGIAGTTILIDDIYLCMNKG